MSDVTDQKPLVIYHGGGCYDGFCCAWLFSKAFPDAEFVPAVYGTDPPDVTGRDVYIADFSYKRPVMLDILDRAASVAVLDHHKTAVAELAGLGRGNVVFDADKSGARLAWEYLQDRAFAAGRPDGFFTDSDEGGGLVRCESPWLVDYTEDRDLWRWELPQSRFVNAALRSFPLGFAGWDVLHGIGRGSTAWTGLLLQGEAILRAEQKVIDSHVGHAREVAIAGHKVLCVNATVLSSEIAGALAAGRPFGACYFDRADGKRVYSLRSRDGGVDVSEVAGQFGGGGHRNAAGFEVDGGAADTFARGGR